jgi:hypothetical protein
VDHLPDDTHPSAQRRMPFLRLLDSVTVIVAPPLAAAMSRNLHRQGIEIRKAD